MATSTAMQTILAASTLGARSPAGVKHFFPATTLPRLQRNARSLVRSLSEDDQKAEPVEPVKSPSKEQPAKQASTNFLDVFAFSGPGPERINGRLAMIGFVAALAVELSKGEDVFSQISNGGIIWFLGTSTVLTLASLIPLFKGVSAESKSNGLMTADAELWNGRLAMLGLVALAFTEYVTGAALV